MLQMSPATQVLYDEKRRLVLIAKSYWKAVVRWDLPVGRMPFAI